MEEQIRKLEQKVNEAYKEPVKAIQEAKEVLEQAGRRIGEINRDYTQALERLTHETTEAIGASFRVRRRNQQHTYPRNSGIAYIKLGVEPTDVCINIKYSGLKREGIISKLFWSRDREIVLQGEIGIDSDVTSMEKVEPLRIKIGGEVYSEGEEVEEKIAEYLSRVIKHALAKSRFKAAQNPERADLTPSFEAELVARVSRMMNNNEIMFEYAKLVSKGSIEREIEPIRTEYERRAGEVNERFKERLKSVSDETEKIEKKLEEIVSNPEGIIRVHDKNVYERIKKATEKTLEKLKSEREKGYRTLEDELGKAEKEKRRIIGELDKEIEERRRTLQGRKGELEQRNYFIKQLGTVFPNYDPYGNEDDVTPVVRTELGVRMQKMFSEKTDLTKEELLGLLREITSRT
ncbi:hypothetical protein COU61_00560, partial [Candidatus Pacearchaeota archaeon CG10_big_fil_rev_8_21_14_0_10_35_13]